MDASGKVKPSCDCGATVGQNCRGTFTKYKVTETDLKHWIGRGCMIDDIPF